PIALTRLLLPLSCFPPSRRAATLAAIVTVPFRILSLLLCLLIAGPMSTPAWALARPETRVGNFFQTSPKSAAADLDQTLESRRESRGCGYDFASGVCKYGYRWYSPYFQRWLNRDPIGENAGINLYTFVHNEPVGFVDADGRVV